MGESTDLVEHFFRHESANLVAVLTRAFGVRRIDLIEDMVQAAMLEAMGAWKHKGIPSNPAGWIHRVAKNRILDALRREQVHQRALAFAGQSVDASNALVDQWLEHDQIHDSLLRMIFVCCHPALDRPSQVALTLKILCGFGNAEIARGLLINLEAAKKRIQRAKRQLAELNLKLELPPLDQLNERLATVHAVLYLMFNEGYSASHGPDPIRDDLCEEAARLCHMLCDHKIATHTTYALLSLMLFHASRLDARVDANGFTILLEDQDRTKWDQKLIQVAQYWLAKSNNGVVTPYHLEAAIALQHCLADSVAKTDWSMIVKLYDRLITFAESPVYILNRAIARGQAGDVTQALTELDAISNRREMKNYYLLDCAKARLHQLAGSTSAAIKCYETALARDIAEHERRLLERQIFRIKQQP